MIIEKIVESFTHFIGTKLNPQLSRSFLFSSFKGARGTLKYLSKREEVVSEATEDLHYQTGEIQELFMKSIEGLSS